MLIDKYSAREVILGAIDFNVPQKQVAEELANMMLHFAIRLDVNSHSHMCDGRKKVCDVLHKAYEDLKKIAEE